MSRAQYCPMSDQSHLQLPQKGLAAEIGLSEMLGVLLREEIEETEKLLHNRS